MGHSVSERSHFEVFLSLTFILKHAEVTLTRDLLQSYIFCKRQLVCGCPHLKRHCSFRFKIAVFTEISFNVGVATSKLFQGKPVSSHVVRHKKKRSSRIEAQFTVVHVFPKPVMFRGCFTVFQSYNS